MIYVYIVSDSTGIQYWVSFSTSLRTHSFPPASPMPMEATPIVSLIDIVYKSYLNTSLFVCPQTSRMVCDIVHLCKPFY